jgi:hypothetical protein
MNETVTAPVPLCDDAGKVIGYALTPRQLSRLTARPGVPIDEALRLMNPLPSPDPEPTPEDHEAMFRSVVWFHEQGDTGALAQYAGKHVAILGETIIDADADPDALTDRLEAKGDALPNRIVVQYVPGAEDLHW